MVTLDMVTCNQFDLTTNKWNMAPIQFTMPVSVDIQGSDTPQANFISVGALILYLIVNKDPLRLATNVLSISIQFILHMSRCLKVKHDFVFNLIVKTSTFTCCLKITPFNMQNMRTTHCVIYLQVFKLSGDQTRPCSLSSVLYILFWQTLNSCDVWWNLVGS